MGTQLSLLRPTGSASRSRALAGRSLEGSYVSQILRPSGCTLVLQELAAPDGDDRELIENSRSAVLPSRREVGDSIDSGEHVDSERRNADLVRHSRAGEVFDGEAPERRPRTLRPPGIAPGDRRTRATDLESRAVVESYFQPSIPHWRQLK